MKTRADELREQKKQIEMELAQLAPHETMTGRELGRVSGVSPMTATRFKAGDTDEMQSSTLRKLLPYTNTCPICEQSVAPLRSRTGLQKFIDAQNQYGWDKIMAELEAGQKAGHWIWFVFPQIAGLGYSDMSLKYSLMGTEDALDYLAHPILNQRITDALAAILNNIERGMTVEQIMGDPLDAKKLKSSMTLFAIAVSNATDCQSSFHEVLNQGFQDKSCLQTLKALGGSKL